MNQKSRLSFFTTEYVLLFVILSVAAILRFTLYADFSYSNDELSALMRLRYDTFSELVSKGFYVDGHPGGIQVFLWFWVRLFGESEAAARLPFVLAGILSVYLVYRIGKYLFGSVSGLFAASAGVFC